jgi:serine phosphatase RsbU (regulator of sigma subunit)/anti-sigma regulatory factor (Ser/Thr protein kinase)
MIAIGVAGGILNLLIVQSALAGLSKVDRAYGDVGRIVKAQGTLQDATSLMNALHADVLVAVLNEDKKVPGISREPTGGANADAIALQRHLDAAGAQPLPATLMTGLRNVRLIEDEYVRAAKNITARAAVDAMSAQQELAGFTALYNKLGQRQSKTTAGFAAQARAVQEGAEHDEHQARLRIIASALIVMVGFLGLSMVLGRLGRRLALMAAREREVAETLQHSLLPAWLPQLPGLELAARYVPGGPGAEVGGDWYDAIPLSGGRVGLVIGDVVGHDLRAATVMGQMRHALHAHAVEGLSPRNVLERLNYLSHQQREPVIATCIYAVLDPVESTLTVANAGHYPALVVTPSEDGSRVAFLEQQTSPPIGATRNANFTEAVYDLPHGSRVVLYTDGLVEARAGSVETGLQRLREIAAEAPESLEETCEHLLEGMLRGQAPRDDVAMLVVTPTALIGDHLELTMPTTMTELAGLRRAVGRWLGEVGAGEDEAFEIMVACGEAATNAIEHAYLTGAASYRVSCHIDRSTEIVEIVVRDWGRWKTPTVKGDRGRGLHLIHALMDVTHVVRGGPTSCGSSVQIRRKLLGQASDLREPVESNEWRGAAVAAL